ncbi:MAG: response regulator [Methylocystaceae bacterium]|nr:MAG: response regulator [Methylocystaceae bacterium]
MAPGCSARILVIEDEPAIAADLSFVVEDLGYSIAGTASSVDEALRLIDEGRIDGAILDANLHGVSTESIADALRERDLPFFVLSGYLQRQLPASLAEAPFLAKPYNQNDLSLRIRNLTS